MSWGEVKKINSDMSIPLNVLLLVNELKTNGENSYVYNNLSMMSLIAQYDFVVNDIVCKPLIVDAMNQQNSLGVFCKKVLKSINPDFDSAPNFHQVLANDALVTEIFSDEKLSMLFYASPTFKSLVNNGTKEFTSVLFNNDAFATYTIANPVLITHSNFSINAWTEVLDKTNFIDRILVPEHNALLKKCMNYPSPGGLLLDGLARSPKGLSTFLKSKQPVDVVTLMYSKYNTSGYGTYLKQTLGSTLYFSLKADQWDTAASTVDGKTTYFNASYPRGSNVITKPAVDTSFALLNEVKCSQSSTGIIRRLTHPEIAYITYTGTTTFPGNNVVIGGFVVEPSISGYCILKYKIYEPK